MKRDNARYKRCIRSTGKADVQSAIGYVLSEAPAPTEQDVAYIRGLVEGTTAHGEEIDRLLETHMQGWRLDRLAKVDLSVLRLAVFELLYETDVDVATIVNEAVELAKLYGTESSGKFVNGVLARVLPAATANRD